MFIPLDILGEKTGESRTVEIKALLDSGAGGTFMDLSFAEQNSIPLKELEEPIKVYNVDGTRNKEGKIAYYTWVELKIGEIVS